MEMGHQSHVTGYLKDQGQLPAACQGPYKTMIAVAAVLLAIPPTTNREPPTGRVKCRTSAPATCCTHSSFASLLLSRSCSVVLEGTWSAPLCSSTSGKQAQERSEVCFEFRVRAQSPSS